LWYKVHDNPDGVIAIFQKDNWCKWKKELSL
jgi:hypothetical protein